MYHILRGSFSGLKMSYCSFTRFCVMANCGFKSKGYTVHTFDTTVCNNAKPGKRIVRHFNAIAKCGTSTRATDCVNAIYGIKSITTYCVNAIYGIKSMDYMAFTFYTTYCVNAICGRKSMDYSLYFLYHILR